MLSTVFLQYDNKCFIYPIAKFCSMLRKYEEDRTEYCCKSPTPLSHNAEHIHCYKNRLFIANFPFACIISGDKLSEFVRHQPATMLFLFSFIRTSAHFIAFILAYSHTSYSRCMPHGMWSANPSPAEWQNIMNIINNQRHNKCPLSLLPLNGNFRSL